MNWTAVGRVEELGPGFHLRTYGAQRVVIAVIDAEVFAFDPLCPHAGGPLELAETDGCVIACPLHGWRFDLRRGGQELHGYRPTRMFDLRIEAGRIYVALGVGASIQPAAGSQARE